MEQGIATRRAAGAGLIVRVVGPSEPAPPDVPDAVRVIRAALEPSHHATPRPAGSQSRVDGEFAPLRPRLTQAVARGLRSDRVITGEASPYYLVHPLAPERVGAFDPDMKLIAILRDPVDRALSHYHHEVRHGVERLSFEGAIGAERERLASKDRRLQEAPHHYCYHHHFPG